MQLSREKRILFVYALETTIARSLPREMVRLYMRSRSQASSRVVTEIHTRAKLNSAPNTNSVVKVETNLETPDRIFVVSTHPKQSGESQSSNLHPNPNLDPSRNCHQASNQNSNRQAEESMNSVLTAPISQAKSQINSQLEHPIENLIDLILKWATEQDEPKIYLEPQAARELRNRNRPAQSQSLQEVQSKLAQKQLECDRLSEELTKFKRELHKRDRQFAALSSKHQQDLAKKEKQLNDLFQELLQVRAELIEPDRELENLENLEKSAPQAIDPAIHAEQLRSQLAQKEQQVKSEIFKRLLVTLDVFDLAIHQVKPQTEREQSIHASYQRLREKLLQDLQQFGVAVMETTGKIFDPTVHEAVIAQPTDKYPEGTILAEIRRGYLFQDRVLRYAQVKVAVSDR
jgi:molecular chaperone GrpE (heat shock protein)